MAKTDPFRRARIMFVLRAAFWLSIVVLLIPGDPKDGSSAPGADAWHALLAVRGAIADISGLCDRQPDVCVNGGSALQAFAGKARQGAELLSKAFEGAPAAGEAAAVAPLPAKPKAAETLTDADAKPAWRAPAREGRKA
jgi:hypothetical protein